MGRAGAARRQHGAEPHRADAAEEDPGEEGPAGGLEVRGSPVVIIHHVYLIRIAQSSLGADPAAPSPPLPVDAGTTARRTR